MVRRKIKNQAKEYVIAGVLALLLVWLMWLVWGIAQKEEIARHAAKDTEAELATLDAREAVLKSNLDELSTARGQEATLRETFGVARPGEEVIIVVPTTATTTPPALPWWRRALGFFGL